MARQPSTKQDFYNEDYFDTDEEGSSDERGNSIGLHEEKSPGLGLIGGSKAPVTKRNNRKIPTNDELLYDPSQDDRDEAWVAEQIAKSNPKKKTDGILSCPMCFSTLCLDCQRHESYHSQYRAMFVQCCRIDRTKRYRYNGSAAGQSDNIKEDEDDAYFAVRCEECKTHVAMLDQEEVYHFFNVLAN